ncbi:MAG: lipoprotein [Proteobacteria bacterium]|nr:lipoprotein [Pseudomonadota bacterium]
MTLLKQALLAMLIASALAACGVRGDPEAPPSFTQQ